MDEDEGMLLVGCAPGCWALFMMGVGEGVGVGGEHILSSGKRIEANQFIWVQIQTTKFGKGNPSIRNQLGLSNAVYM